MGPAKRPTIVRRIAISSLVAAIGSFAGFQYAASSLPESSQRAQLVAMHAILGAVAGLMIFRFASVIVGLIRDWRSREK